MRFPGTIEIFANEGSLCWFSSEMKNKSLKYEKSEKLSYDEILIWIKKFKVRFFNLRARVIVRQFFFWILSKDGQNRVLQVYPIYDRETNLWYMKKNTAMFRLILQLHSRMADMKSDELYTRFKPFSKS